MIYPLLIFLWEAKCIKKMISTLVIIKRMLFWVKIFLHSFVSPIYWNWIVYWVKFLEEHRFQCQKMCLIAKQPMFCIRYMALVYLMAATLPLELPPTITKRFGDGWKQVRLITDVNDSPVTSRNNAPWPSKISIHRGLFMLPQQKISISGCHFAWNVVNHRPEEKWRKWWNEANISINKLSLNIMYFDIMNAKNKLAYLFDCYGGCCV
jgi:hypothetical protein